MSAAPPIPAGLFFAAGAAAAFNPCGIAMLPAYVALLPGKRGSEAEPWAAGLAAGAAMTVGFLTVFGLVGAAGSLAIPFLAKALPYLGLLIGAALAVVGSLLLIGKQVNAGSLGRMAGRISPAAGSGLRGSYLDGLAYALASLGCTFPLFAALVAGALASGSWVSGARAFALYALGMGVVVTAVWVAATLARGGLQRAFDWALPWVERLSGGVVLAMGLYLLHYWLGGPGAEFMQI